MREGRDAGGPGRASGRRAGVAQTFVHSVVRSESPLCRPSDTLSVDFEVAGVRQSRFWTRYGQTCMGSAHAPCRPEVSRRLRNAPTRLEAPPGPPACPEARVPPSAKRLVGGRSHLPSLMASGLSV